jgi:ribonuclease VapC
VIIDTSALVAIARAEPEAEEFLARIHEATAARVAAPTLVEFFLVADRSPDPAMRGRVDQIIERLRIETVPFTREHTALARQAHHDFGRGSGHRARLNFGDCMTYALAKATGEPLLYKGDDFVHTDIRSARDS